MFLEIETMISDDMNIQGMISVEKFIKCVISGGLA